MTGYAELQVTSNSPHMLTCGSRWFVSFHREGPRLVIGPWLACLVMLG
jgi:hypothetical protein